MILSETQLLAQNVLDWLVRGSVCVCPMKYDENTVTASGDAKARQPMSNPLEYVGRTLANRFRIDAHLGTGAFGAVYRARQLSVDRDVAVKILRKEALVHPTAIQRFFLEAKATSQLNHAHTITIHDFGQTDDGLLFIAMEYLPGCSLRDKIHQDGPVATTEAIRIIGSVAASLAEAHAMGIVHRDLKPANIFLTERPEHPEFVKVIDFGIARAREFTGDMALTATGHIVGTPSYMAPETVTGQPVDARADVYALGIILFEMLTGTVPFKGPTPFMVMRAHQLEDAPILRRLRPELHIPKPLCDLVRKCLSKPPDERPEHAADFLTRLNHLPAGKDSGLDATASQESSQIPDCENESSFSGLAMMVTAEAKRPSESTRKTRGSPRWLAALFALSVLAIGISWLITSSTHETTISQERMIALPPTHRPAPTPARGTSPHVSEITTTPAVDLTAPPIEVAEIPPPSAQQSPGRNDPASDGRTATATTDEESMEAPAVPRTRNEGGTDAPSGEKRKAQQGTLQDEGNGAPAPTVTISFDSDPRGAQTHQGDQTLGETPFQITVPLTPRPQRVTMRSAGFKDLQFHFTADRDQRIMKRLTLLPPTPKSADKPAGNGPHKTKTKKRKRKKPSKIDVLLD